eukprot:g13793.t1
MYGTSYDYLFTASVEARCGVRRLLEIGIGSVNPASPGHMLEHRDRADDAYSPGPSLRVWRDVFPNAEIFGFDIDPDAMIHGEPRIQTFTVDTVNKTQVDLFFYEQFDLCSWCWDQQTFTYHLVPPPYDWDYESYAKARWGRAARNRANYSEVIYRPSSADPSSTSLAVAESVGVQPPSAGTAFTVLDGEEGRYREDLEEVPTRWDRDAVPTFDIIIDDGLHVPLANDASMSFLWPYLSRNNGLYVIEDLDGHLTEQAAHYRAKFDQRFTPVMMIVQGTTVASNIIALRKTVRSPGHVPVTAAQLDPKNQLHPRHCWNRLDFAQSDWEGEAVNRTFENCCLGSPNAASRKLCYKPTDAHPNWEADFYSHNIAGSNWLELFYMATLCCAPRIVARTKDVHILKYFHVPSVEDRFFGTSGGAGGGSKNFGSSRGDTVVSAGTRLM